MLGFSPLSTYPISAYPSYYTTSGVSGVGRIGTVSVVIGSTVNVTGVSGIGRIGTVSAGAGTSVTVTGVKGTGVLDHVCLRIWDEVDTVDC